MSTLSLIGTKQGDNQDSTGVVGMSGGGPGRFERLGQSACDDFDGVLL